MLRDLIPTWSILSNWIQIVGLNINLGIGIFTAVIFIILDIPGHNLTNYSIIISVILYFINWVLPWYFVLWKTGSEISSYEVYIYFIELLSYTKISWLCELKNYVSKNFFLLYPFIFIGIHTLFADQYFIRCI